MKKPDAGKWKAVILTAMLLLLPAAQADAAGMPESGIQDYIQNPGQEADSFAGHTENNETEAGGHQAEYTDSQGETSTKYTRAGNFTLTQEGYLVNNDGMYVLDTQNRRIQLDTLKDAAIDSTGSIIQDGRQVARIQVTDFEDYDYLEKFGDTFFQPVEGATPMEGSAEVKSGVLEMSNMSVISEMVNMIAVTRAYESNQKIMQTYDESLGIAVSQLGKVQ